MVNKSKAIEAVRLSLTLGRKRILQDISFSVGQGQFLAVIGPNGAGKSTLLKCVGGLIRGWDGEVRLLGENVAAMTSRAVARCVAWVHQTADAEMPYTVRQFASMSRFALRPVLGGETDEERDLVKAALKAAGVERLAERRLSSLSGGERQRALIAAAIAQGTDILFLDEPTSYLDYAYQSETLALIKSLNKNEGKTIVMVTHDVNLAIHGASDVLAVKDGSSVWQGRPCDLLRSGLLYEIFGTEFELFTNADDTPYAVPRGLVR